MEGRPPPPGRPKLGCFSCQTARYRCRRVRCHRRHLARKHRQQRLGHGYNRHEQMSRATPHWQVLSLMALTVVLGLILWWRLQPPPPQPSPPTQTPPQKATVDKPVTSKLLPVSFVYPAAREQGDISRFEVPEASNPLCLKTEEAFSWDYKDVLRLAGAPSEVVDFQFDYSSLDQSKQQPMVKRRNAYLDKSLGRVVQDFYAQVSRNGNTLLGTSTEPVPNGSTVVRTTYGGNDTLGDIAYQGRGYRSFFKSYSFPGSSYPDVFALTLCRVS